MPRKDLLFLTSLTPWIEVENLGMIGLASNRQRSTQAECRIRGRKYHG